MSITTEVFKLNKKAVLKLAHKIDGDREALRVRYLVMQVITSKNKDIRELQAIDENVGDALYSICLKYKVPSTIFLVASGFVYDNNEVDLPQYMIYSREMLLDYLLHTDDKDIQLKVKLENNTFDEEDLISRIEYYRLEEEEYLKVLEESDGTLYRNFNIKRDSLVRRLVGQLNTHCTNGVPIYQALRNNPRIHTFLNEQAKRFSMSEVELLEILGYSYDITDNTPFLEDIHDRMLRYILENVMINNPSLKKFKDIGMPKMLADHCFFYNVKIHDYLKGIGYKSVLSDESDIEMITHSCMTYMNEQFLGEYDSQSLINTFCTAEDIAIKNGVAEIFPNYRIEFIRVLMRDNPKLYKRITDRAKRVYMTDIRYLQSLGFVYCLKPGTKEYVEDNIHKYIYEDKYFCAHSNDRFYWMLERMFRPQGDTKYSKESETGRKDYIESLEGGKYKVLKANDSRMSKHKLYITPYAYDSKVVIAEGREILSHFAFKDIVFLPSSSRKYRGIDNLAHSLGLDVTEFILVCNYDRRDANGNITLRNGNTTTAESMRGICKLYAPSGESHFDVLRVVKLVKNLKKKSEKSEEHTGKNIVKEFKDLLKDYVVDGTIFLGKDSEIYDLSREIVRITKVETIVLILYLGFNVYYETDEGAKYMETKGDILEAILRAEGLGTNLDTSTRKFANEVNDVENIVFNVSGVVGEAPFTSAEFKEFKLSNQELLDEDINKEVAFLNLSLWKHSVYMLGSSVKDMRFRFARTLLLFASRVSCSGTLENFDDFFPNVHLRQLSEQGDGIYKYSITKDSIVKDLPKLKTMPRGKVYFLRKKKPTLATLKEIKSEPRQSSTVVDGWVRNPKLVKAMKEFYDFKCQLCGGDNIEIPPIISTNSKGEDIPYVEVHHIRELSASLDASEGTDIEVDTADNALVVCSYHHTYLHKQSRGLNKLVKKEKDVFITNEDGNESIKITTNKHLLIED